MKFLKMTLVVLIHAAFVLKPQELSQSACGFYDLGITYYKFLNPEIINQPNNKPLFFTFDRLYDYQWFSEQGRTQDNLSEWKKYFQNQPTTNDIKQLVYKATTKETKLIKNFVSGISGALSGKWRSNSAVKYLKSKRATDIVTYLLFAKKCEPYVASWDDSRWRSLPQKDKEAMQDLIINGNGAYLGTSNKFLKMRYAYQLTRLAHYSQNYPQTIKLYDKLVKPLANNSSSLIKYWALAHKAGALMLSGNKVKGAYLFAKVFDQCPSRRIQAYDSFKVGSNQAFRQILGLCQNNNETATVYLLRGIKPYANAIEEMQNIYQVVPSSPYLSLLLTREINKMEVNLLSADLSKNLAFYQKFDGFPKQEAIKYLKELKAMVAKVIQERKVKDVAIWQVANCYLEYVAGNPAKALRMLNALSVNSAQLKTQAQVFRLAIKIAQLKRITKTEENALFQQVRLLKHKHLQDYLLNVFRRKLYAQGDIGKAYLCNAQNSSLPMPLTMKIVDNLIAWEKQTTKKTLFEETLNSSLKNWYKIKATMYLREDKLQDAIKYYQLAGVSKQLTDDPKSYTISGRYGHPRRVVNKYTQKSLAQEILTLKKQPTNPQALLDLGNIYYNMTWFGNVWEALEDYRSSSEAWSYRYNLKRKGTQVARNFDMAYPLRYFNRAISLAHTKGNKELAAKATYMAAKCEQMAYQVSKDYKSRKSIPAKYLTNFKLLQQQYSSTAYHQQVVKECAYYNYFLRR